MLSAIGGLLSLLLFPVGYGLGVFVIGIQTKNPACSKKLLDSFCRLCFLFFGIGSVCLALLVPIFGILTGTHQDMFINAAPGGLGIACAAYKIRRKYIVVNADRK